MKNLKALLSLVIFFSLNYVHAQSNQANQCDKGAPTSFLIPTKQVDTKDFFERAHLAFLKQADHKTTIEILKKIEGTGTAGILKTEKGVLKTTRKYSAILRSVIQITTDKHEAPEDYADFVVDFGHLNDRLVSTAPNASGEAQKLSSKVLKAYKKIDFKDMADELDFASQKSVFKYYKNLKNEATDLLSRPKINLESYHRVRKIIKEYLNFYQLSNQIYGEQSYPCEFAFLNDLNDQMGELNDEFTSNEIDGTADEKTTFIEFPSQFRPLVESFLSRLEVR